MKKRTKNLLRLWGISFIIMLVAATIYMGIFLIALMAAIIIQDATTVQP